MKPKINLCWHCNRKFHGNHFTIVQTVNGPVHVHKQCVAEIDGASAIVAVRQP
jgi:hypothetical protein